MSARTERRLQQLEKAVAEARMFEGDQSEGAARLVRAEERLEALERSGFDPKAVLAEFDKRLLKVERTLKRVAELNQENAVKIDDLEGRA